MNKQTFDVWFILEMFHTQLCLTTYLCPRPHRNIQNASTKAVSVYNWFTQLPILGKHSYPVTEDLCF